MIEPLPLSISRACERLHMSGIRRVRGSDATPLPLASMSCEGVAVAAGCSIARCVMRGGGQAVGALQAALTGQPALPNPAGHGPPVRGKCGPPAIRKAPATGSGQAQAPAIRSGRCSGWPRAAADQSPMRSSRRGAAVSPAIRQQSARNPARCMRTHIAAAGRCGLIYRLDSLTAKCGPLACFGRRRAVSFACCPENRWRHWRH